MTVFPRQLLIAARALERHVNTSLPACRLWPLRSGFNYQYLCSCGMGNVSILSSPQTTIDFTVFTAGLRVLALPEVGSVRGGWFLFRDRYLRMYTHMHAITTVKKEGTGLKERGAG